MKKIFNFNRMNKELFDVLELTKKQLDGTLDSESQRYLDRSILERKLDGNSIFFSFRNISCVLIVIVLKDCILMKRPEIK